jgi:hypothetical protein
LTLNSNENFISIQSLIINSKEFVKYFKQSGLQSKLSSTLKQNIEIRWDSTLLMLESIHENLLNIKQISLNNSKVMELIARIDEKILYELIKLLKPLYDLRLNLCKESEPTFHLVVPTKYKMISICKPNANDIELIKDLKIIYQKNIELYFKISDLHFIGSLLYPPIKNLNNLASNEDKTKLIKLLQNMIEKIENKNTEKQFSDQTIDFDFCIESFADNMSVEVSDSQELNEIQTYLNSNDMMSSKSILQFWSENRLKYPRLYVLANRLSSIPATNLSSERNFNYSGLTLTDKRSRLEPNNVNKLLFIRSNYDLYSN